MWCMHTAGTASPPACMTLACAHDRRSVQNPRVEVGQPRPHRRKQSSVTHHIRIRARAQVLVTRCAPSAVLVAILALPARALSAMGFSCLSPVPFSLGCGLAVSTQLVRPRALYRHAGPRVLQQRQGLVCVSSCRSVSVAVLLSARNWWSRCREPSTGAALLAFLWIPP